MDLHVTLFGPSFRPCILYGLMPKGGWRSVEAQFTLKNDVTVGRTQQELSGIRDIPRNAGAQALRHTISITHYFPMPPTQFIPVTRSACMTAMALVTTTSTEILPTIVSKIIKSPKVSVSRH